MSIRTKMQIGITAVVLCVCTGTTLVFYMHARNALFEQIRQRLSSLAATVALQIDPHAHDSLLTIEDETLPAYREIKGILQQARDANPDISYIYTMRPAKDPSSWHFVVDAEDDPELLSHIGEEYDVSQYPEMISGLRRPSADTATTSDEWGEWISGYAPITNGSGQTVGIVGVDMSVQQLADEMSEMKQAGIIFVLLGAILALILGNLLSTLLLSPLGPFIERLNAAIRGDLNALADDSRRDEIGEVARSFNNLLLTLNEKDRMLSRMSSDYLTGLPNHRHFHDLLREQMLIAQVGSAEVALLMIDLDRFKMVNDSLGHTAGDEVLRQVARLLVSAVPDSCMIARYGAEEFAIILPGASAERATAMAESICEVVSSSCIEVVIPKNEHDLVRRKLSVTVSVGVSVYPHHSREHDGLIMAADIALYRAKHLGRNRACAYDVLLESGRPDPYQVYSFIQDPTKSAMEALAAAVDARDHYTANHSKNVSSYTLMIGQQLGLSQSHLDLLHKASLLHDVGKIGVPDHILNKPGALTDEEKGLIRAHPEMGETIVRNSRNLDAVIPGILHHHEHYDGNGYPHGLSRDEIPLLARIISVADAYDALTTNRPYRRALSSQEAVLVLRECSGSQLDPDIVETFILQIESSQGRSMDAAA